MTNRVDWTKRDRPNRPPPMSLPSTIANRKPPPGLPQSSNVPGWNKGTRVGSGVPGKLKLTKLKVWPASSLTSIWNKSGSELLKRPKGLYSHPFDGSTTRLLNWMKFCVWVGSGSVPGAKMMRDWNVWPPSVEAAKATAEPPGPAGGPGKKLVQVT